MAYPNDWPFDQVASATCDDTGAATLYFNVPAGESWTVFRMATYGTTTTQPGQVKVWRGARGSLLASSSYAVTDTSENDNLTLMPGETLRVEWTACDPGAVMTFSIEGTAAR